MKSNPEAGWAGGFLNVLKGPVTFRQIRHQNSGAAVFTFNYQIPMPGFQG
jgi:hypothetical protein